MWKAAAGAQINLNTQQVEDDDWETDPDFINDVTEQEQRWGSTTVEGSGRTAGAIDMDKLRKETEEADASKKKKELIEGPNASYGYGGKFGVQKDRMDQSAVGHDYVAKVPKHVSQTDYSTGFGGKFGIQTDRIDKSAVTWEHKEKVEKHASQKDYATGFGGKFGVQKDRQDKSAVGWDHVEKVEKHESQKDYSVGFGGKFGVQKDRQDKSAVGWDHHEAPQKHESQTDHKVGFGGKFGVQTDRMDKSAVTFNEEPAKVGTTYTKVKPDIGSAKPSDLRNKFEHMAQETKPEVISSPAPKKTIHSKVAMFDNASKKQEVVIEERVPKQLDQSKTQFLQQQTVSKENISSSTPRHLDQSKIAQFTTPIATLNGSGNKTKIQDELEQLKQIQQQKQQPEETKETDKNVFECSVNSANSETFDEKYTADETLPIGQEDEIVDTGVTAVALYDYQAAADDEISFDPEDVITHVEMIHEGWWRGLCKGKHGLFPANYVQLQ